MASSTVEAKPCKNSARSLFRIFWIPFSRHSWTHHYQFLMCFFGFVLHASWPFFLVRQYVFPPIFSFFGAILLTVAQRHVIWTLIFGFPSSSPPTIWRTCANLLACTFRFSMSISKLSCSKYSLIGILLEKATRNLFFVSLAINCFSTPTLMYVFPLLASYFVYFEIFERGWILEI